MNLLKVLPLLAVVYSLPSLAAPVKTINESNLYGNWLCKHEMLEPSTNMKIKVNYQINYAENGQSHGAGTVLFNITGLPPLEFRATDNSTWKIKNGSLIMSSTEMKFVNVSHPELDSLLNLEQILPTKINESAQILELTKTTIKVKADLNGGIYTCSKVASKS